MLATRKEKNGRKLSGNVRIEWQGKLFRINNSDPIYSVSCLTHLKCFDYRIEKNRTRVLHFPITMQYNTYETEGKRNFFHRSLGVGFLYAIRMCVLSIRYTFWFFVSFYFELFLPLSPPILSHTYVHILLLLHFDLFFANNAYPLHERIIKD